MITIDEFLKIELKVGTVMEAEVVEGSEKLLKLMVDLGEEKPRQILSGIKQYYKPEDLAGKQVVIVSNLEPKTMMGLESHGMILCASSSQPVLLQPISEVSPGVKVS